MLQSAAICGPIDWSLPRSVNDSEPASRVQSCRATDSRAIGHPVGGNPTQYAVEKAIAQMNLDWRFLSLEVTPEGLADAVRGMRAMGFRGGTIASPHRRDVLPLLDDATTIANLLGSVNFIRGVENHLVGDNAEARGLIEALCRIADPAGMRCLVLDAGDLARAVTAELPKPATPRSASPIRRRNEPHGCRIVCGQVPRRL